MPSDESAAGDVVTVAEATLAGLIGGTPAAVTVIVDGRVVYANEAAERLLGQPAGALLGREIVSFVHADEAQHARRRLLLANRARPAAIAGSFEMDLCDIEGAAVRVESLVHAVNWGDASAIALISCDVTAREQRERQLAHAATHDSLTGLPNRALLLDRLELSMARIGRSCAAVLVMLLDLDQFKTVNDTLGHSAGDQILREVASRLDHAMRGTDTVARLSGDEFVICADLTDHHPDGAAVRGRVEAAMSTDFRIDDVTVALSAGIGSIVITEPRNPLDVLADVDQRMYKHKRLAAARRR
jgi:diguanylate cyclase (GGDEF)-like protein/PAS domain S-box-containing protein